MGTDDRLDTPEKIEWALQAAARHQAPLVLGGVEYVPAATIRALAVGSPTGLLLKGDVTRVLDGLYEAARARYAVERGLPVRPPAPAGNEGGVARGD